MLRLYDVYDTPNYLFLVLEHVEGGELFDYAAQRDRLPEDDCRGFMRQIVAAVDYMHRAGVCHRDLKLENILLDVNGQIKIIDFGLGNFFDSHATLDTFCGSTDYAPPECWLSKPYHGPETDVWSMGVILFILASGFLPFNDSQSVIELHYMWPSSVKISVDLQDLVKRIFQHCEKRCTVEEMIEHPWMDISGKLERVGRQEVTEAIASPFDDVLSKMEKMGLPRAETEASLRSQDLNQLTTTYALVEFQRDVALRSQSLVDPIEHEM